MKKQKLTKNQKKMQRLQKQALKGQKKIYHSKFARMMTNSRSNRSFFRISSCSSGVS